MKNHGTEHRMESGEKITEKFIRDLKAVIEDGQELLRAGVGDLSKKSRQARERLQEALDSARDTGRQMEEQLASGARTTDRFIRQNPYPSAALAFGVGLLVGMLIARSKNVEWSENGMH